MIKLIPIGPQFFLENKRKTKIETLNSGTPLDYSSDLYRVYIEVIDPTNEAITILSNILGKPSTEFLSLDHGYEFESPIQSIPDIVRALANKNIAIFQVVRHPKTNK